MNCDSAFKRKELLNFPSGPVTKTPSPTARGTGSIPSQGTKVHALYSPLKKKRKALPTDAPAGVNLEGAKEVSEPGTKGQTPRTPLRWGPQRSHTPRHST